MKLVEPEFGQAFEAEMSALLARRFRVLCAAWGAALGVLLIADVLLWWGQWRLLTGNAAAHGLQLTVLGVVWMKARSAGPRAEGLLRLSHWLVVINAAIGATILHAAHAQPAGLLRVGYGYLFACVILPWTPRQALHSGLVVWLACVLSRLLLEGREWRLGLLAGDALAALQLAPGLVVCWLRTTRLGRRVESAGLRRHYEEFHRDLFDARRIHEALFPRERTTGFIRFTYRDQPRLGIGGDLLAAHESPDGSLSLILLDVAGDGIAAALTVHRLHGEIERLFAEDPNRRPREMIAALDRYSRLTLAPHGVYATGFAMRFDRLGSVCWCGAGHAPVFIRRLDGTLERLESSTWPFGASEGVCGGCEEQLALLGAGDVLIAFSDGACEWRDRQGRRLGYDGAEAIVRTTRVDDPLQWPAAFLRQLSRFRGVLAEPEEDVLVAAVCVGPEASAAAATGWRTGRFLSATARVAGRTAKATRTGGAT